MVLPFLIYAVTTSLMTSIGEAGDTLPFEPEFSGSLLKRVNGKTYQAQVFGKGIGLGWNINMPFELSSAFQHLKLSDWISVSDGMSCLNRSISWSCLSWTVPY